MCFTRSSSFLFFFNAPATTEIYTLSLHDALPIWWEAGGVGVGVETWGPLPMDLRVPPVLDELGENLLRACPAGGVLRSEEHTSELQSHSDLVCRLLLEKKKNEKY